MLASFLFAALLIVRSAPDSFLGKAFKRGLVEWPAERLSRLTRGQILLTLVAGLLLWAALVVTEGEAIILLGMAMPEAFAFFAMFEISTMADILIAAALISTQTGLRAMARRARAVLGGAARRLAPRARRPRTRAAAARKADNDDEEGAAVVLAKAA
jgi:hypothetical protein